jgi:beta-fructofuranosidase
VELTHRPRYHFLPLANWMNDPNGLIQWRGRYHLFYQHNPHGAHSAQKHWGHAVGDDLVHWAHLPIALAPMPRGPDKDGCYTGCAVDNTGTPTLVYTGVWPEVQCVATSSDELITWQRCAGNPVIGSPPEGMDVTGFRDPYVWREGDLWYAVIGSGIRGVGGTALLYRTPDLIHWEYVQPICVGDEVKTGRMWECPNLFPLGGKHVLLVSCVPLGRTLYFVGEYADCKFSKEVEGLVDLGECFYAPQVLIDDRGRRTMWGWLREGRSEEAQRGAGWAGVMSLPRILSISAEGRLASEPAPELSVLRGTHHRFSGTAVEPGSHYLRDVRGDSLEIQATFALGDAEAVGLSLRCSPNEEEQTLLVYDRASERLIIDRPRSSASPDVRRDPEEGSLRLGKDPLTLRVFLDKSVVEVFANHQACLTSRVYPTREDSVGLALYARGGRAESVSLDIWEMKSIWTA